MSTRLPPGKVPWEIVADLVQGELPPEVKLGPRAGEDAALVEIGFLTNRLDEQLLKGNEERDRIAAALVRAALEFGRRYDERRGGPAARPRP